MSRQARQGLVAVATLYGAVTVVVLGLLFRRVAPLAFALAVVVLVAANVVAVVGVVRWFRRDPETDPRVGPVGGPDDGWLEARAAAKGQRQGPA